MRILYSANAIWCSSGYGMQGRYLLPRLVDAGHTLGMFAWYGLEGGMQTITLPTKNGAGYPMPIYPKIADPYGNDVIELHARHFGADVVITLMDVWVLHNHGKKNMRWIPWLPIDQEPVPEAVVKALEGAYRVVTYADYGKRLLDAEGIPNVCIPHGVDTQAFAPRDKAEAKRRLKLDEDCFLIGMVAANKGFPSRKAFPEQLRAVANLKARHPGKKIKLYLHTMETTVHGGVDMDALLLNLGFKGEDVTFVNQYQYALGLSDEYMANAYNAMDVYLGASMSEGFGIPIIEAQACGVPVITTNATAMPEITFSGIAVDPAQPFWSGLNAWIVIPSVDGITEALEWSYQHAGDQAVKDKARQSILPFDWDVLVREKWVPFLNEIEAGLSVDKALLERMPAPEPLLA